MKFYNFHTHSHYSVLDCVTKIPEYVLECKNRGLKAAACTDHGSLSCCYELWKTCRDNDIKPVLGVEAYFVNSYDDVYAETAYNYGHIVMLAMNETGWNNIKKLQNIAWERGLLKKPRIQLGDLLVHNEGIIITTGCVDGLIGYWLHKKDLNPIIQDADLEKIEEMIFHRLKVFKQVFKDRLYGEIQLNDVDIQVANNKMARNLCTKLEIPLIVTGDTHYIRQKDSVLHDLVKCVLWRDELSNPDNHTYSTKDLWMKTNSEMLAGKSKYHDYISIGELKGYILNTQSIEKRIENFDILPNVRSMPVPDTDNLSSYQYLIKICKEHPDFDLIKKYKVYHQRFSTELRLLLKKDFIDYFLIVNDICQYAKSDQIPFNARGSVCGSLIAYLMNITWIDPIRFKCPFERFLSEDRTSMPDIDLDFSRSGRGMIIKYLQDKYGEECVANICAFSKWKPKVAIKDAARVFGVDYKVTNDLTRELDGDIEWNDLYQNEKVVEFFQQHESVEKYGKQLLGLIRQFSTHASGVLLTAGELTKWCPIAYQKDTKITEWDGTMLESLNLLKVDILGVNMLDIVATTVNRIKEGNPNSWNDSNVLFMDMIRRLEDDKIYKFIGTGQTVGTFQLGTSGGMRALAKDMRPDKFNDICATISLHRTALLIMKMDAEYVNRKRGGRWEPIHPKATPILQDTYGILLYQSQTTQIAHHLAGFTYVEADAFRKAIKKKDAKVMAPWKDQFISGCETVSGIPECEAIDIWCFIEAFSQYGFNRAHATSYAFLAYVTCYLKFYYPGEYMASLLKHNVDDSDKLYGYMQECCRMKIQIVKPDINNSTDEFVLKEGKIYCPINFVKGVGEKALVKIIDNKPYKNFDDFLTRSKTTSGIVRNLILSDSFKELMGGMKKEELWKYYRTVKEEKILRSLYCYDCKSRYPALIDPKKEGHKCPNCEGQRIITNEEEVNKHEFDDNFVNQKIYGFNIWNDTLAQHIPMLEKEGYVKLSDLVGDGVVRTVFEIKKVRMHRDKNDNIMAFVQVSDNIAYYDLIMFADMWERKGHMIKKGKLYVGKFKKENQKLILHSSYSSQFKPVTITKT